MPLIVIEILLSNFFICNRLLNVKLFYERTPERSFDYGK